MRSAQVFSYNHLQLTHLDSSIKQFESNPSSEPPS